MRNQTLMIWLVGTLASSLASGCATVPPRGDRIQAPEVPAELNKITLPEHVIEAPDILGITAINALPKRPYKIHVADAISVTVQNPAPDNPINGVYIIDPEGNLDLGSFYLKVYVTGMTLEEAQKAVEMHLKSDKVGLKNPIVTLSITRTRATQQISGEHLVRADGTVYLGTYGNVYVAGLTLSAAKKKVEDHLKNYLDEAEISLDVLAYNSKVIYVIIDGAGVGQQVYRLPVTGNETVLDAMSQVNGLGPVSDKHHIWVARPTPQVDCDQVLPVDWVGITTRGRTHTNYQLLPGDRLYVKSYTMTAVDNTMARLIAPLERVLGVVLLGTSTANSIATFGQTNGASGP